MTEKPLICEDCGKRGGDVSEGTCPYAEDVNNSTVDATLCTDCYHERCMDI